MMSHIRRAVPLFRSKWGVCRTSSVPISGFLAPSSSEAGLVLQSCSTDIYQNLALEDWIDANVDLQEGSILLLWRNQPAVVVGRHQNPWKECSLPAMREAGICLARRRSGGGTVYHDLGNLNLTFFTSKKAYDRRRNLKVVTDALQLLHPSLAVQATDRFDILLNRHLKISGSASRLSRKSSYHHCTLLHSADRSALSTVLRPSCPGIQSNATPSVPSPVTNLVDHVPSLCWKELLDALARQYNTEFGLSAPLAIIDPKDESVFPGIDEAAAQLQSWEWIYGKTPKFSVQTSLDLEDGDFSGIARLHMEVKNGVMESCVLDVPADWIPPRLSRELSDLLIGERFCRHRAAAALSAALRCESGELYKRLHKLCEAMLSAMG